MTALRVNTISQKRKQTMHITKDYLHFPASATIEDVLRTYRDRDAHWWWLLTTEIEGAYYVCSFGSLLPYLTGRTPHIVHNIGDCPICSGIDPLLWQETDALVEEALADRTICSRLVSELPLAELPVVAVEETKEPRDIPWYIGQRATGVIENGVLCGVGIIQFMSDLGRPPDF